MAFICTIDPHRIHIEAFVEENGECSIIAKVGEDDAEPINYFVNVGFSPSPPDAALEFHFSLVKVDAEYDSEEMIREGSRVAHFIAREDRAKILNVILNLADHLIKHARPEAAFMVTYECYLPERALEKYRKINQVFMASGYKVVQNDEYHGQSMWWLHRGDPE
jgi:hypothetical protein